VHLEFHYLVFWKELFLQALYPFTAPIVICLRGLPVLWNQIYLTANPFFLFNNNVAPVVSWLLVMVAIFAADKVHEMGLARIELALPVMYLVMHR
jgi:hypothetical protein